jgi:hypothetical protein
MELILPLGMMTEQLRRSRQDIRFLEIRNASQTTSLSAS